MLIVSGTVRIDPAERSQGLDLIGPLVAATNEEAGCIAYDFWEHPSEPGLFRVFEEWADQAALDAHFASGHMAAFLAGMGAMGRVETDIAKYEVSAKGPVA